MRQGLLWLTRRAIEGLGGKEKKGSMKILLISANRAQTPHPVYPLALDFLRGVLEPPHQVLIQDMNSQTPWEGLASLLEGERPGLVGVSIRNIDNVDTLALRHFLPEVEEICRFVRQKSAAPLVLGGAGYSLFPRQLLDLLEADYGVVGEGSIWPPWPTPWLPERIPWDCPGS